MRQKTVYICECCGKEYSNSMDAYKCEANCLGIDIESYKKIYARKSSDRDKTLHSLYEIYNIQKITRT